MPPTHSHVDREMVLCLPHPIPCPTKVRYVEMQVSRSIASRAKVLFNAMNGYVVY